MKRFCIAVLIVLFNAAPVSEATLSPVPSEAPTEMTGIDAGEDISGAGSVQANRGAYSCQSTESVVSQSDNGKPVARCCNSMICRIPVALRLAYIVLCLLISWSGFLIPRSCGGRSETRAASSSGREHTDPSHESMAVRDERAGGQR